MLLNTNPFCKKSAVLSAYSAGRKGIIKRPLQQTTDVVILDNPGIIDVLDLDRNVIAVFIK